MDDDTDSRHIREQPFCVLCRATLKLSHELPVEELPPSTWAEDVFAFFQTDTSDARACMFRADLFAEDWRASEHVLDIRRQYNVKFWDDRERPTCDPEDALDFAHAVCIQLAKETWAEFSLKTLQHIAQYARPLLPWRHAVSLTGIDHSRQVLPPLSKLSTSTPLGRLIQQIEQRLPFEAQKLIYDNVTGLFSCLARCFATLIRYGEFLSGQNAVMQRPKALCPLRNQNLGKIGANFVRILDEVYLKDIGATTSSQSFEERIDVIDKGIRGFQYSIGAYGVVAFRILYEDDSQSPWIGSGTRRWTTTYEVTDLTQLRAISDGAKLLRLDVGDSGSQSTQATSGSSTQMFWDHETILPRRARHPFTDTYKAGAQILAHPEARLARLVQISQDELRSLTLQFGHGGLTGMSFNNSPRKTSTENPWPFVTVTHTLQRGEKITSFHLVMQGQHNGPYIVVQTSHGNTLYYGHHLSFFAHRSIKVKIYSFEIKESEAISGFFYDPTVLDHNASICMPGITLEPQPREDLDHPNTLTFSMKKVAGDHHAFCRDNRGPMQEFFNTATLIDVKRLNTLRVKERLVGLRIERNTGAVDYLGQWDPGNQNDSLLYDSTRDGLLESLRFVYGPSLMLFRTVTDITIHAQGRASEHSEEPGFTWDNLRLEVVWWFSMWQDEVGYWQGEEVEVNLANPKFNHVWVR